MTSHKMLRRELLKRIGMTAAAVALSACVPAAGANPINQAAFFASSSAEAVAWPEFRGDERGQ